jgi:homoserine O-acetyltransferase
MDSEYLNGDYYPWTRPAKGLALARMIGHITYLSDDSMEAKFGRRLQDRDEYRFDISREFQVESYLNHQGVKFVERFDANTYLYITKAMDYFDVAQKYGNGNLAVAFERIKGRILIISFSSDWLFPPDQSREMSDALIKAGKNVSYVNIETPSGHDAFLVDIETESRLIKGFLEAL